MRNPDRIDIVLDVIREIWKKYPDLRLTQLIGNCFPNIDAYYKEDDELLDKLNKVYE